MVDPTTSRITLRRALHMSACYRASWLLVAALLLACGKKPSPTPQPAGTSPAAATASAQQFPGTWKITVFNASREVGQASQEVRSLDELNSMTRALCEEKNGYRVTRQFINTAPNALGDSPGYLTCKDVGANTQAQSETEAYENAPKIYEVLFTKIGIEPGDTTTYQTTRQFSSERGSLTEQIRAACKELPEGYLAQVKDNPPHHTGMVSACEP